VEVVPGQPRSFKAVLDWGMSGFDVEAVAVPRGECNFRQVAESTILVEPGQFKITQVFSDSFKDPQGGSPAYSVNVSRLRGDETTLRWARVEGTFLMPQWDSALRVYTVYLNVEQDVAKLTFQRLDNGQSLSLAAQPEVPLDSGGVRRLSFSAPMPVAAQEVTIPPAGEVQHTPTTLAVPVDVGHQRMIDLTVTSAQGRATGSYRFMVSRPFCPEEKRFFEPGSKVCTEICDEGYFGNVATGRCTRCIDLGCAVCEGGLDCSLCLDSFALQADGSCLPGGADKGAGLSSLSQAAPRAEQYSRSHMPLVMGGASACLVAFCACIFIAFCGGGPCDVMSGKCGNDDRSDDDGEFGSPLASSYYGSARTRLGGQY